MGLCGTHQPSPGSTVGAPPWEAAVVFVCLSEKHAAGPELAAHLGVFLVSSLPLQSGCKPHASSDPQDRA